MLKFYDRFFVLVQDFSAALSNRQSVSNIFFKKNAFHHKFMKRIFSLLFIIAAVSHFGTIALFAQKRPKPREVIVIEFTAPNNRLVKREVLINRTPNTDYRTSGGGASGAGAGCGDCSREQFEELNRKAKEEARKKSYGFTAKAWRMGNNQSNVSFGISVGGNCRTQKTFAVSRFQKTEIKLDCGINLTAYYGIESKEANRYFGLLLSPALHKNY